MNDIEIKKECACRKQIIWFFEQPTIIACENCQITFYHNIKTCPYCKAKVTAFVKAGESEW